VFEQLRQSFNELLSRTTTPEDRRNILARMKESLVQARMGLDDLRGGVAKTRARLDAERRELETIRRRKALAESIQDTETVTVAARFEAQHAERVEVLARKLEAQESELALTEREVEEMGAEFKRHMAGAAPPASTAGQVRDPLAGETGEDARQEIDALAREHAKAARDLDADRRLEELKRKMGR
jgi:hypothetical protein